MRLITNYSRPESLAGTPESKANRRDPLRVGAVQHHWLPDAAAMRDLLAEGVSQAAAEGAKIVFLPELTLSRYPADTKPKGTPSDLAEDLETGPTRTLAAELAQQHGIYVHASLYQRDEAGSDHGDGRGFNTAIVVGPDGRLAGKTHKLHIPITAGYYEDKYFREGPASDAYPVYSPDDLNGLQLGLPTCWDEWFPELARVYSLEGAELLAYPTAIGSEPDHPDFDTQPLWQQVIVGNGIANGLFMVVPNRWGTEGLIEFYGMSFISDPYGRILVRAPRSEDAVLVADLDLDQCADWLTLFPFLTTRRPDAYAPLTTLTSKRAGLGSVEP